MAAQSRQIIKDNGYENTITVIQSKVEDITELPDGCEKVILCVQMNFEYSNILRSTSSSPSGWDIASSMSRC